MSVLNFAVKTLRRFYFPSGARSFSSPSSEEAEDVCTKYETILNKTDVDGWEIRRAMCAMHGMDMVPAPATITAALKACRRNDDYALAVRILEAVRYKCVGNMKEIWPYILAEIQPTLDELGIDPPEKLGYDKPELALRSVFEDDPLKITK